jgi:Ca2+-binding RTX toxin-like protein
MFGGAGNDQMFGGDNGDNMVLGDGSDIASAGDGDDFVNAADDRVQNDTVDCGPGDDTVRRDFIFTLPPRSDQVSNCEHIVNN